MFLRLGSDDEWTGRSIAHDGPASSPVPLLPITLAAPAHPRYLSLITPLAPNSRRKPIHA